MQKMRVLFFGIILALLYLPVVYAQSRSSADCNLMEVKADNQLMDSVSKKVLATLKKDQII